MKPCAPMCTLVLHVPCASTIPFHFAYISFALSLTFTVSLAYKRRCLSLVFARLMRVMLCCPFCAILAPYLVFRFNLPSPSIKGVSEPPFFHTHHAPSRSLLGGSCPFQTIASAPFFTTSKKSSMRMPSFGIMSIGSSKMSSSWSFSF